MTLPVVFWALGCAGLVLLFLSLVLGDFVDALDVTGGAMSTAVLGGFAAAFGIAGGAWAAATGGTASALLAGLLAGTLMGAFALGVTRTLTRSRTDRALTSSDLLGAEGVVLSPVRAGAYGEVQLRVGGHPLKLNARADHDLHAGARVFVVETLSSTSVRVLPL